jgi:branched-chain amino acid transport system ATP-binding protein
MAPILKLDNVTKHFGGVEALTDVTLKVEEGSITGLIGPNGSGKSTLFNCVSGFYVPDRGNIVFEEKNIKGMNPNDIYNMGLARTFQHPRLFSQMTTLENFMLSPQNQAGESILKAPFKRLWKDQEVNLAGESKKLIERFEMDDLYGTRIKDLSGGHMKMVETSKGVLGGAKLVLLDEPTAGIQYSLGRSLFEYVKDMREKDGLTFLIIEHRIDLLFDFVDYVYVLHEGRLLAEGDPDSVSSDHEVQKAYFGDV